MGERQGAGAAGARAARGPNRAARRSRTSARRAYREVAARIDAGTEVTVDDEGKLHVSALEAIPDPESLIELRTLVRAMLPRVGLPEVILEVMSWLPGFVESFTSVSGGRSRLDDLRRLDRRVPVRARDEHRLLGGRQARRTGSGARPDQPREPELRAPRDLHGRQPLPGRPSGGDRLCARAGRRARRRGRRDAVRRARPLDLRAAEPQVLRSRPRRHLPEHDHRPGGRPGRRRSSPALRATHCTRSMSRSASTTGSGRTS